MLNLCSLLFILIACFNLTRHIHTLGIVGGTPTKSIYPFFVRVKGAEFICGGTFVSTNVIATAAHCLFSTQERRWSYNNEIFAISSNFSDPMWRNTATWYVCNRYMYHKFFNIRKNDGLVPFDIALVLVSKRVQLGINEISVLKPCPDRYDYPEGFAIGLGKTHQRFEELSTVLMGTKLQKYNQCGKFMAKFGVPIDDEVQTCYGSPEGGEFSGTCDGDSGSPIVHIDRFSNTICFIGINSLSSTRCVDPEFPSIFTKAGRFTDWIENSIKLLEQKQQLTRVTSMDLKTWKKTKRRSEIPSAKLVSGVPEEPLDC